MNPSWDLIDVGKMVLSGFKDVPCWHKPPLCTLVYGGISTDCVMTDLNIKMTSFFENGQPSRADVSVTLKEQSYSVGVVLDFLQRYGGVFRSYGRSGFWDEDVPAVTPGVSTVKSIADMFS
jgi:hypothetical protein